MPQQHAHFTGSAGRRTPQTRRRDLDATPPHRGGPRPSRVLPPALERDGHVVELAPTGRKGLALALRRGCDLILLDLRLGKGQGLELLVRLRQEGVSAPLLAIGGGLDPATVVRALDAGADEYVAGPIDPAEIAARTRAALRRAAAVPPVVLTFENVALKVITPRAFVDGRRLRLSPKELRLLQHLLWHIGAPSGRTELLETIWEMRFDPGSNVVDVHVSRLRSKLLRAAARVRI